MSNQISESEMFGTKYFSKLLREFLSSIYWVIAIFLACITVWAIYYLASEKVYLVKSLIKINDKAFTSSNSVDDLFSDNSTINLEEQIFIFSSYSSKERLTKELYLNVNILDEDPKPLNQRSIIFNNVDVKLPKDRYSMLLKIKVLDEGYALFSEDGNLIIDELQLNENVSHAGISFNINYISNEKDEYSVVFTNLDRALGQASQVNINKSIETRNFYNQGQLLEVSLYTPYPNFGIELVNSANEIYIKRNIEANSQESEKSLAFLDEQIKVIKRKLNASSNILNEYRQEFESINIEKEIDLYLEQLDEQKNQLAKADTEIEDSLRIYKSTNPIIVNLNKQKERIQDKISDLEDKISSLPDTERKLIELTREVNINQQIYEQLIQKQIEFSILNASTLGGVQIVDSAYLSSRVSPQGFNSLLMAVLISIVLIIMFILVKMEWINKVRLPSDIIEGFNLKIMGVIPAKNEENEKLFNESVKTLVTNVLLLADDEKNHQGKVIEIIGATPGVGKSFSSISMAKGLSAANKKVLLIDFDLRKGQLHKEFNLSTNNLSILNTSTFNFDDFKIKDNLYFFPKLKNSGDDALRIIDSQGLINFLSQAKELFDFIVVDTPPILVISDALYISKYADIVIPVVRHEYTTTKEIGNLYRELENIKIKSDYIIYNSFEKPSGYYGYDYYSSKYYGGSYYSYYENNPEET